jgi:hypothetical protein
MLNYDPEEREEIEQALESIGYTLEDLSCLEDVDKREAVMEKIRDVMDVLGLTDFQDLEDFFKAGLRKIRELH